jgi:hypothetical protein
MRHALTLLRIVILPFRAITWVIGTLSGDFRHARQVAEMRQEWSRRVPLSNDGYLSSLGSGFTETVAIAVRNSVAKCCYLPAESLRAEDSRADLETLFVAPPDAHWLDLGGSWFEVLFQIEHELGVELSVKPFDRDWSQSIRSDRLSTLRDVVTVYDMAIRKVGRNSNPL